MGFAVIMGWIMSRLVLSILFFLVITPISILARVFNKKFLEIEFDKDADTYWVSKKSVEFDKKCYENQF